MRIGFYRLLLLLGILLALPNMAKAQEPQGHWDLNLRAEGFFRNNEYAHPYGTGYTLPGYRLSSLFGYHIPTLLHGAIVEAGVHMLGFYGAKQYPWGTWWVELPHWTDASHRSSVPHLTPLFSLRLKPNKALTLRLGLLDGRKGHNLIEPLYNPELSYIADPEMGVELQFNHNDYRGDLWINWQSFTFRSDNHQEAFIAGLTTTLPLLKRERITVETLLQAEASHRGGEISWHKHDTVHTYAAAALGSRAQWHLSQNQKLQAEAWVLGSASRSEPKSPNGAALYLRVGYHGYHSMIALDYWKGYQFVAPMAAPFVNSRALWEGPLVKPSQKTGYYALIAQYQFFNSDLLQLSLTARAWHHSFIIEQGAKQLSHSLELHCALTPRISFGK